MIRACFPWGPPLSDEHPVIEPLQAEHARDLRLPWLSRFNQDAITFHLSTYPGLSLWVPKTGEYGIGEQWRHRSDIAQIVEVSARKGKPELVRSLLDLLRERDYGMVVLPEQVWRDNPRLYAGFGFDLVERIVFFQKDLPAPAQPFIPLPELDFKLMGLNDIELLMQLDHSSFPWLWWNSREEFELYSQMEGVYIYGAFYQGEPVGYASFTLYEGWAHLDRLAVIESRQGRKFGAAQLQYTLQAMSSLKASHVALSTQETNFQSHRLYRGFGFRQGRDMMAIYGSSKF